MDDNLGMVVTDKTRRNMQDFFYHVTGRKVEQPVPNTVVSRVLKIIPIKPKQEKG